MVVKNSDFKYNEIIKAKELFNIISYFDMTPAEFFAPLDDAKTPYRELCEKLKTLNDEDLKKVSTFISWIEKKE